MSIVVNLYQVDKKFAALGWSISDVNVTKFLAQTSIAASTVVRYLDALIANPDGCDDQTIASVTPGDATKITNGLKSIGVVLT